MRITQKAKKKIPTITIYTLILIGILSVSYFGYAYVSKSLWPFQKQEDTPAGMINYDPPTQEEVDNSQAAKDRLLEEQAKQDNESKETNSDSNKKRVTIGVSYADVINGSLEIRAFTADVINGDGTCTAIVKKDEKVITKTVPSFIDATSTICEPIYIPELQLATGTWSIVVNYTSPTHTGTSGVMKVSI